MKRWSALLFSLHSRTVPWVCSRHISTVKKAHDKIHVVIRTIARYGYLVRSVAMQPLLTERSKQAGEPAQTGFRSVAPWGGGGGVWGTGSCVCAGKSNKPVYCFDFFFSSRFDDAYGFRVACVRA